MNAEKTLGEALSRESTFRERLAVVQSVLGKGDEEEDAPDAEKVICRKNTAYCSGTPALYGMGQILGASL